MTLLYKTQLLKLSILTITIIVQKKNEQKTIAVCICNQIVTTDCYNRNRINGIIMSDSREKQVNICL